MTFNDRDYTRDAMIKQLGLVELHCKDGSALDAGCACIETKHLYNIEGLSEEGVGFALTEQERKFFQQLGEFARATRKRMEVEDWSLHGVMRETMKPHVSPECLRKVKSCMESGKPVEECRADVVCR